MNMSLYTRCKRYALQFRAALLLTFFISLGIQATPSHADTLDGKPIAIDIQAQLPSLTERAPGKFSFLIVTDLHFTKPGVFVDRQTMQEIKRMSRKFSPEAIIVTGDMVSNNPNHEGQGVLERAVADFGKLEIPWIYVWGNHDQMDDYELAHKTLSVGKNSIYRGSLTDGNYRVKISETPGGPAAWNLVIINDSRGGFKRDQLDWFNAEMSRIRKETPEPPPSFVLMHIPLKEIAEAGKPGVASGVKFEESCPEEGMTGSIGAFAGAGVKAIFFGHDHVSDFYGSVNGVRLQYARSTGHTGYGEDKMRKGGTLVTIDTKNGTFETTSVFPDGSTWSPKPNEFIVTPEKNRRY